jgi:hypothetical protein
LLGEGATMTMSKGDITRLPDEKDILAAEIDRMKSQIKQLKMEVDIWRTAAEIVEKARTSI